jgi:uncharacterized protein YecE (DUF72 family)
MSEATVRVGIGGWIYEPWRETFYPEGLPKARELAHASRAVTAIEINATYYRLPSASTFAKWREETPDGFVFSVKASRYATQRRVLAEAGESVQRFVGAPLSELGDKLGPIVWQFATSKAFDADDFGAFLALLPRELAGRPLRHAVEVRHPSFACEPFLDLARSHGVAAVFADSDEYPSFSDATADFVYARLMRTRSDEPTGYGPEEIAAWAWAAREWRDGREPSGLPRVREAAPAARPRDVFLFFISGAKERAPAAAVATLDALAR